MSTATSIGAGAALSIGRYLLYDEIAAGGMATVHLGRLLGQAGFARTVAIKRLHPHAAKDMEFAHSLVDEARIASRIRHPNVVTTIDVVQEGSELFLVMEYVHGESLARLLRPEPTIDAKPVPVAIAVGILADVLHGLHSAHEARDEMGVPLDIVHRDVSPQNLLVGADGITRVLDFGIAKATSRMSTTREGRVKGKIAYMSPEQLTRGQVDRRTDVFAASIVLWEALTGRRLFAGDDTTDTMSRVLHDEIFAPGRLVRDVPPRLDALVMRGLSRDPASRFGSAREMALALEGIGAARAQQIGAWVESIAGTWLQRRAARVAQIESDSAQHAAPKQKPIAIEPRPEDVATMQIEARPDEAPSAPSVPGVVTSENEIAAERTVQRRKSIAPRVAMVIAAAAVLAVATIAVVRMGRRSDDAPNGSSTTTSSSAATTETTASTTAPTTSANPGPPSNATPTSDEIAPITMPTTKPTTKVKSGSGTKTKKPSCDPPFYIDDEGVKRFKPGCI
jgi:serine/threonine-protein kinase